MVTVKEMLDKTSFDEVFSEYKKHYEEQHQEKLRIVFEMLKTAHAAENHSNMTLFIRAIKDNEQGDDIVVEHFNCNDKSVFFDVSGVDTDFDGLYSISSSEYSDLLGYFIQDRTLTKFSFAQILAHILWELDW